ncbi:MAG TPA: BTAD domain-containing putative transcriptional regulator [Candidatus Limnocylindrales bacterium]|nr:BTAD domain-containing putative transcriptional regulator [Candidatus Limnocylindrales bacterium]
MRFQLLGPLRFRDSTGEWRPVPAGQQRVVLALLLADAGRAVPLDRLIAEIWGERPPRTAVRTVQGYVFRLRRLLGGPESSLRTRDGGYVMVAGPDDIDMAVFERLVAAAKVELAAGRVLAAQAKLTEALALWRGPVFADVPTGSALSTLAASLEEARLDAEEEQLDLLLRSGQPAGAVTGALRLLAANPLRERLYEHLMLGLYRCGRRAEAIDCYQRAREAFVTDLGVEPGPRLRQLHRAVLNDEPYLAGVVIPAAGGGVAQLPADVKGFTGRRADLEFLRGLSRRSLDRGEAPVVVTVAGPPGVGKTALAVHWAHRIRSEFGDGQLYVNLRGYASSPPLRPLEALAGFLAALGVPADQVPVDADAAAALYRSLLADRRVLVLLDNAGHADQVRPLLPGSPGCLVVITSRDRLDGLVARDGAVRLTLEALSPGEATTLLEGIIGVPRVSAEPDATARVASLCDHLPLALRIAAADLVSHPKRSIAGYAARLGAGDRLTALEVDGDEHCGVRAAFSTSYAALRPEAQRLLRLLGLPPGADVTAPAAAALAAIPREEAGRLLDKLCAVHLVTEHAAGRYAMHDLLRLYAASQAGPQESAPALDRWYDLHLGAIDAAAQRLYPQILRLSTLDSTAFDDDAEALAWLDAERANLVAAIVHAAAHGPQAAAWRLADALRGYLYLGEHTVEWRAVADAAHQAATASGDARAQVSAELSLAALCFVLNRYEKAIEHNTYALGLARRAGWPAGESTALCNLGAAYWAIGDVRRAADHHAAALAIDFQIDRVPGQAANLGNLGPIYAALGRLDLAGEHRAQAIALSHRIGSHRLEGLNLAGLAEIHHAQGRAEEAVAAAEAAVRIFQANHQRQNEPYPLCILARVHRDRGRDDEAMQYVNAALTVTREQQDQFREASALVTAGGVHLHFGRAARAIECHSLALDLATAVGDRYVQTEARIGLASALDRAEAIEHAREALETARACGYRLLEHDALTALAADLDDPREARLCTEQAQAIRAETGYRPSGASGL